MFIEFLKKFNKFTSVCEQRLTKSNRWSNSDSVNNRVVRGGEVTRNIYPRLRGSISLFYPLVTRQVR